MPSASLISKSPTPDKLNDRYQRTILCKDPFKPVDPRVEELINSA